MSQDQKIWYFHENDENHGPCDIDEMKKAVTQGRIAAGTYVWRVGMENWDTAENVEGIREVLSHRKGPPKLPVPEAKMTRREAQSETRKETHKAGKAGAHLPPRHLPKRKAKFQVAKEDLSTFITLNPHDVDDSTKLMRPGALRSAKKEAQRALSEEHGSRKKKFSMGLVVFGSAAALGVIYFGHSLSNLSPLFFGTVNRVTSQIKNQVASSGIPSDIPPSAYLLLAAATQSPEQGSLEVLKTGKGLKPSFYVAGNVSNDVNLVFNLFSETSAVHVQFPMKLMNGFYKTEPLHTADGKELPAGAYAAIIFEEDEQTAAGRSYLSQLKVDVNRLPPQFVKGEKKIQFAKKMILP